MIKKLFMYLSLSPASCGNQRLTSVFMVSECVEFFTEWVFLVMFLVMFRIPAGDPEAAGEHGGA